ncbi:hypothetical protein KM043_006319 [Ampulex compressa]|nr:hypothetical protein KM043_006319 [Ampulex compressa]
MNKPIDRVDRVKRDPFQRCGDVRHPENLYSSRSRRDSRSIGVRFEVGGLLRVFFLFSAAETGSRGANISLAVYTLEDAADGRGVGGGASSGLEAEGEGSEKRANGSRRLPPDFRPAVRGGRAETERAMREPGKYEKGFRR